MVSDFMLVALQISCVELLHVVFVGFICVGCY